MVNIVAMQCPACNANLSVDENGKQSFCQYCGARIRIDDGSCKYTHVYIDQTRERELELEEKKLEREREIEQLVLKWKWLSLLSVVLSFLFATITYILIKNDFNVSFNFAIFLLAGIITTACVIRKGSVFGNFLISIVFSVLCIMFISSRNDFDATFTIMLFGTIGLSIVASLVKSKEE